MYVGPTRRTFLAYLGAATFLPKTLLASDCKSGIDVVVLMDTSTSMDQEIKAAIASADNFSNKLETRYGNVAFGVVSFGDSISPANPIGYAVRCPLTTDHGQFLFGLSQCEKTSGGTELTGITLADTIKHTPWRENKARIILLYTDEKAEDAVNVPGALLLANKMEVKIAGLIGQDSQDPFLYWKDKLDVCLELKTSAEIQMKSLESIFEICKLYS